MVKSGVSEEASADACCLTCRQSSFFGNAEAAFVDACLKRLVRASIETASERVSSCETCLLAGLRPASDEYCDQASRKGIWWMPWYREAMKDVARCDKPGGDASDR